MRGLKEKRAVVTGAASGLGKAIAQRLHAEGCRVWLADLDLDGARAAADALPGSHALAVDVTDEASVQGMLHAVVAEAAGIDILVNNAGVDGARTCFATDTSDNWRAVIDINLTGVYYGIRHALPGMIERKAGVILNMASIAGFVGFPILPAYNASKAGVMGLTRSAALEAAPHGVRVNALAPSVVDTPLVDHFVETAEDPEATRALMRNFNPLPGMVTTEAVASAAAFLVSDEAAFITGATLPVDGGYTAQ